MYTVINKDIKINYSKKNLDEYDGVIITFPIWVGSIALPMNKYIELNNEKLIHKKIFFLIRCSSSEQDTIFNLVQGLEKQYNLHVINACILRQSDKMKNPEFLTDTLNEFARKIDIILSENFQKIISEDQSKLY